jgi:hypothetical protein
MNTLAMMLQRVGALEMSPRGIVNIIVRLIIYGIIFGILYFLINRAPFITDWWKSVLTYALYALTAIFVIYLLLGLVGS